MIKQAGFIGAAQLEQPAYNSSPITKGAMFTATKPAAAQAAEALTEEEKNLVDGGGLAVAEEREPLPAGYLRSVGLRLAAYIIMVGALLLLSSGRWGWPHAWAFIALSLAVVGVNSYMMIVYNPDLIMERMESLGKENVKPWDRILVPLLAGVGPITILLVSGIQARYVWPPAISFWPTVLGFILYSAASVLVMWAMRTNRFFSAVMRIQKERGHKVVNTGPYAYIRHPGYASSLMLLPGMALALGSTWALIPAFLTVALYFVRTALEDNALINELEGYKEYTTRVRYRLIPWIW